MQPYKSMWSDLIGVPFSQGFIDAGGLRTRYLSSGSPEQPLLLFLHGVGGHAEAYVRNLAAQGLARLSEARAGRNTLGQGAAALLSVWQVQALLVQVQADPGVVGYGTMGLSEFARRRALAWAALTGRW